MDQVKESSLKGWANHVCEGLPIRMVVAMIGNPCILVDGCSFIWTPTIA